MRATVTRTISMLAMLGLAACAPGPGAKPSPALATDEDVKAMRTAAQARLEALQAGDIERYLSVYQDDAVIVPPHSPEIIGKAGARSRLTEAFKEISIEAASDSREYEILGPEWIAERGRYSWTVTPKEKGQPFDDSGNFMLLWHKGKDGSWRIAWEMWTSSRPLVEPKGK
mgnify:CR=1 FL=1